MNNKLDYYLFKIERQLDFHRGLHLFEMEMNSNFTNKVVFLKENQEEYITNLFGDNKNIRESYNREFNNVIVESTFNPKDEVKKFFSFLKENYINEIKKTNIINEQSSKTFINEQWQRGADPIGYWTVLFNQLKTGGIGVKYGANGKTVTDPKLSTFMYWGGWVIWKDGNINGGYPVAFTDPATKVSMVFKFKGGKYAGQPSNNIIIEPKTITSPFNLGQFGKLSNKQMSDTITKYQKSNPKTTTVAVPKATAQDLKIGQQVFNELKYAFDGAGTYENEAVAAFNKIKNKFQLTELNRLVKSRGDYPNVYEWLQSEMSDYDYKQYRAIWDRLKGIDNTIVAPKVNNALRAASVVGDVTGVNAVVSVGEKVGTAIGAGFKWLKEKGIPWFMEKLRDALGSTAGAVLQSLLDMTGIGAIGVTILWAALTLFDVWQISSGAGSWAKLFFSVIGLLSAGALAKTIGTFLKPFFGGGGTLVTFFSSIAEKPWFIKYVKPVVGWIGGKLSGAASLLTQAGEWVVKKLGATAIGGMVTKAVQWLKSIAENIVKFAGAGAKAETQSLAKAEIKTQGEKIFTKAVVDPLKDKVKEKVIQGSEYVGGTRGKAAAELAYGVKDLRGSSTDLGSAIKKGDYVKTAEKAVKTYDKFGNVIDKGTQVVTNEPKGNEIKKAGQNATEPLG
jgi:hypothetical protein